MKHIFTFIVVFCLIQASFAQRMLSIESGYSKLNLKESPHIVGNEGYNVGTTIEIPIFHKKFGLDVGLNFRHINQKIEYATFMGCGDVKCTVRELDFGIPRFTESYQNIYTFRSGYYYLIVDKPRWAWKIASGLNVSKTVRATETVDFNKELPFDNFRYGLYLSNTIQYRVYHNMYAAMSQSIEWDEYASQNSLLNLNAGLGYKF